MKDSTTSLDLLHDLELPPEISLWPLAPGWYVVLTVLIFAAAGFAWTRWNDWRSNAYRRMALRELSQTQDLESVAEILRRTALVVSTRTEVARQSGASWVGWLVDQTTVPCPEIVRQQLTTGIYAPASQGEHIRQVKEYAASWIASHHVTPEERNI